MNNHWFIIENAAKFNSQAFSLISCTDKCSFKYNLLDLSFQLSAKVYFFANSWKRREKEAIALMSSNISILIQYDEISHLAIFQKRVIEKQNSEEDLVKKIIAYVYENPTILEQLVLRYLPEKSMDLYNIEIEPKKAPTIVIERDRFCGFDELEKVFFNSNFVAETDDNNDITDQLKSCVFDSY